MDIKGIGLPLAALCAVCACGPKEPELQINLPQVVQELQRHDAPTPQVFNFLRHEAQQGDEDAMIALGLVYATGRGAAKNYNEAYRWFRRAAEEGSPQAEQMLQQLSDAMRKDPAEVQRWLENEAKESLLKIQQKTQRQLGIVPSKTNE